MKEDFMMKSMKRMILLSVTVLFLGLLLGTGPRTKAATVKTRVSFISENGADVSIEHSPACDSGSRYEVVLYNLNKKKVASTTCSFYAAFQGVLKKNKVYYYRTRIIDYKSGEAVTKWSAYHPFTTIQAKKYALKLKSKKKRTVYVKVPKVKGVSSFNIYVSTKIDSGFKKAKGAKPGQKVTLSKCKGKRIAAGKTYYVRIVPKVGKKPADGIIAKGYFYFPRF